MKLLNSFVEYLWPQMKLFSTPWVGEWEKENQLHVDRVAKYLLAALVPFLFLIIYTDRAANLEPAHLFLNYRLGLISLTILSLILSISTFVREYHHGTTIILVVYSLIFSLVEAHLITIAPAIPFYFCVIIPSAFGIFTRLNPAQLSVFYFGTTFLCFRICEYNYHNTPKYGENLSLILSAGLIVLIIARSVGREIDLFISKHKEDLIQGKLNLERLEHLNQLRSLLPQRINERFEFLMYARKLPIIQAMDTVIRDMEKENVAAFFSDIRGFTQSTKTLKSRKRDEIKAILKESTDIVQSFWGIPKPVGDLILSYYDEISGKVNVVNSLCSALRTREYTDYRAKLDPQNAIRRFYLLSYGQATVGNMGGAETAREITIIGVPYNILARIDEMTKKSEFLDACGTDRMIATRAYAEVLGSIYPKISMREIRLLDIHISIRDFPEETSVFIIEDSESNKNLFEEEILADAKKISELNKFYLEKMYNA